MQPIDPRWRIPVDDDGHTEVAVNPDNSLVVVNSPKKESIGKDPRQLDGNWWYAHLFEDNDSSYDSGSVVDQSAHIAEQNATRQREAERRRQLIAEGEAFINDQQAEAEFADATIDDFENILEDENIDLTDAEEEAAAELLTTITGTVYDEDFEGNVIHEFADLLETATGSDALAWAIINDVFVRNIRGFSPEVQSTIDNNYNAQYDAMRGDLVDPETGYRVELVAYVIAQDPERFEGLEGEELANEIKLSVIENYGLVDFADIDAETLAQLSIEELASLAVRKETPMYEAWTQADQYVREWGMSRAPHHGEWDYASMYISGKHDEFEENPWQKIPVLSDDHPLNVFPGLRAHIYPSIYGEPYSSESYNAALQLLIWTQSLPTENTEALIDQMEMATAGGLNSDFVSEEDAHTYWSNQLAAISDTDASQYADKRLQWIVQQYYVTTEQQGDSYWGLVGGEVGDYYNQNSSVHATITPDGEVVINREGVTIPDAANAYDRGHVQYYNQRIVEGDLFRTADGNMPMTPDANLILEAGAFIPGLEAAFEGAIARRETERILNDPNITNTGKLVRAGVMWTLVISPWDIPISRTDNWLDNVAWFRKPPRNLDGGVDGNDFDLPSGGGGNSYDDDSLWPSNLADADDTNITDDMWAELEDIAEDVSELADEMVVSQTTPSGRIIPAGHVDKVLARFDGDLQQIDDLIDNPHIVAKQGDGNLVHIQRNGDFYDIVILTPDGNTVITAISGLEHSDIISQSKKYGYDNPFE